MTFNDLLLQCQDLLVYIGNLGTKILDFITTSFTFFGEEVALVEILFGTGLITFLTIKLALAIIQ